MKNAFTKAVAPLIFFAILMSQIAQAQSRQTVPLNFGALEPVENTDPIYQAGNKHAVIITPDSVQSNQPRKVMVKEVTKTTDIPGSTQYPNMQRASMNVYVFTQGSNMVILQPYEERFAVDANGNTDQMVSAAQGSIRRLVCDPKTVEGQMLCDLYEDCFGFPPPCAQKPTGNVPTHNK